MPRPKKCRFVKREPGVTFFKPQGIPLRVLEHAVITVDELAALRLSDFLGMSHEEAAKQLKVSRPTVTRMLARAHQTLADALVNGKAIRIEGGDYVLEGCECQCPKCGARWSAPASGSQEHVCVEGKEAEDNDPGP
uniref:UPF0251 protein ENW96_08645 n=1 Tax=Desulfobacca acetoxidans TaxID=60893 RepID=A0A7C3V7Z0_9BACT